MANVFKKFQDYVRKPNRYTFDMSFNNNFTTQFGRLTPVFCQEVNPGDSVRINPTFGLNFAPFVYPVQTKIKAHLHFFYVRNRALWSDWMDFIGNTKDGLIPPYLDFDLNPHLLKDGSLADYFGLPTSYVKTTGVDSVSLPATTHLQDTYLGSGDYWQYADNVGDVRFVAIPEEENRTIPEATWPYEQYFFTETIDGDLSGNVPSVLLLSSFTPTAVSEDFAIPSLARNSLLIEMFGNASGNPTLQANKCRIISIGCREFWLNQDNETEYRVIGQFYVDRYLEWNTGQTQVTFDLYQGEANNIAKWRYTTEPADGEQVRDREIFIVVDIRDGNFLEFPINYMITINFSDGQNEIRQASDNPFYLDKLQPISSLPFRAYDAIYNSFYRNPQNNPLMIDGAPEYNKYVRDTNGGKDTQIYNFYNRNWEDDVFTTAVQSPQQGYAPLVGVTSYGEMTFQDEKGTYTARANVAADGDTIESISITSPDMPPTTARALVDMISSGISISDFRNVNSLQRWLERNMRKGLRYKDQMMSHFGSDVRYDELLMPEFIGGISQAIDVNRIINQTASSESPLGSFSGLAQAFGGTNNNITHYADEHGFVIGILSVVPYAVYSQVLPRMFTRFNVLDYFFPEFNHIGMQPVYNKDIAPLQVADSYRYSDPEVIKQRLNGVFGYNRPYFDYISKLDEAHGNFRNNYRDYLLHRVFSSTPYLSPEFLTVSEEDLNDVFAVVDDDSELGYSDKIVGLIHFDYTKKTTVSEFAIPKLEN